MQSKKYSWQDVVLVGIVLLSFFLNFWNLAKEGYSNQYYAAAVKSMLDNPSAFLFGSFDSGLYVTVDKPPLGLWLQALCAKVFGVNSFGLILPSALAGCLIVLLVYVMVKKVWGATAGIISAGIVAATPILVALSRTNNLDVMLIFFLLCGAYFIQKASKNQSLGQYLLAMLFLGLGFNIKMLQAYLVLPAFILVYFMGKGKTGRKILHSAIAIGLLLVVSLSWAWGVDSIPASQRPYIGSSDTNSVLELALGYNGINRLNGRQGNGNAPGNFDQPATGDNLSMQGDNAGQAPDRGVDRPSGMGQNNPGNGDGGSNFGGPGGDGESGTKGVFRLFSTQLCGLISWFLLPAVGMVFLAAAGTVCLLIRSKSEYWTKEKREKLSSIVFWSAWLVPMAGFFSMGGFIHRYYVAMLAPAVGALAAIAACLVWKSSKRKVLVPLCFATALAAQYLIVSRTSWTWSLSPMLLCAAVALLLFFMNRKTLQIVSAIFMAAALFVAPIAWSFTPVLYTVNANIPNAGPDAEGGSNKNFTSNRQPSRQSVSSLNDFLLANYNGERWAAAVASANDAAPIILQTGLPVMAIGGFSGGDNILTLDALKKYVASGKLRFFITGGQGRGGPNNQITQWVMQNGKAVTLSSGETLYDLSPK